MKRFLPILLCLAIALALPVSARADTGPKPSVTITIEGLPAGTLCYGTLLSERESTGPATAYDGTNDYYYGDEDLRWVWQTFVDYQDADGFYYLQRHWDCSEGEFRWGYYPPSTFKVLLYFPAEGTFAVSEVLERYAFDSYFTVSLSGLDIGTVTAQEVLYVEKSYDFTWELISLAARILMTIAIELAIALLFGYRQKKQIILLAVVNVVTQVLLNVALNYVNYTSGQQAFVIWYVLLELAVFTVEAVLYWDLIPRYAQKPTRRGVAVLYALIANAASFGIGLWLANVIPGIF